MLRIISGLIYPILATASIWYWLLKCYKTIRIEWKTALLISFLHEVACALCAVAMSIVEAGFILKNATTYRLYGLLFLLPVFYLLLSKCLKIKKSTAFDVFAVAIVIRLILGRIDCMIDGCCQGTLIPFLNGVRWPIREIEICYYIIFIVIFAKKIILGKTYGQVYPIYLLTYGVLRFILEWVREEYVGNVGSLHSAHIWSLIAIAVGAGIYYKLRKDQIYNKTNPKKSKPII